MDFETLANSFWFVVSAYIAAFLPWTAIASTDFISSKWVSVRRTRVAGYRNLIWTFFPLAYVVFYAVVQGKAKEYTEMCAAAVAAVFAALIGIRTIWGLWQLHLFHSWSCRSIDALRAVGVEYSLLRLQRRRKEGGLNGTRMKSEDIADEILVSEKIIDNQISHGDVQCFIKFGNITLLKSSDSDPLPTFGNRALQSLQEVLLALLDPLYILIPWLLIPAAIAVEFVLVVVGRRKPKKLSMIPKEPVEVWVHWASAFAAQGLQKWMADFEVAVDPEIAPEFVRKRAVEQFHARGKYFGAQLLASAALQLWTEDGNMHGMSPMLWDGWKKDSHMSDGLVVKQELFQEAIRAGKCLPFGAPQPRSLDLKNTNVHHSYYSYDAYQDVLGEFVSELPVRSCFVKEMRKFDGNMLEWLTILLHLGYCALENDRIRNGQRGTSHGVGADVVESTSHERDANKNDDRDTFREAEATKNLRSQLGLTYDKELFQQSALMREGEGPLRILPILRDVSSAVSENNRLVTKAGQLIDVWLSLAGGDQIWFLVEELNKDWKEICLGRAEGNTEMCEVHRNWDLREAHKQLEKRRLERRFAHENGRRYQYLDQYVTFMGYRMESVRTVLGRWLDFAGGKSVDDLLEAATNGRMNHTGIEIKLSDSTCLLLNDLNRLGILGRKGVQCRLVWEAQNNLEMILFSFHNPIEAEEVEKLGLAAVMLLLLSFPGLRVEVLQQEEPCKGNNRDWIAIDMNSLGGARKDYREWKRTRTEQRGTREETTHSNFGVCVIVHVECGPQDMSVKINMDGSGKCTLTLLQRGEGKLEWKWWRDAFSGRLDGFKEWQEDLGITPITLNTAKMENDGLSFKAMDTAWDTEVRVWAEWPPFRPQFCRFELETREFLKQPITVGHKNVEDNITGFAIGCLPLQAIQPVSYAEAHERTLRDSCLLVQESLKISGPEKVKDGGLVWKPGSASMKVENIPQIRGEYEESHRLMLHKFDALHSENVESLKECMKTLCAQFDSEGNVSEAIELLQSFIGMILSSSSLVVRKEREAEVEEAILPLCEELIGWYFNSERQIECLFTVLDICLGIDPVKHYSQVLRLMQRMLSFCVDIDSELYMLKNIAVDMQFIEERKAKARTAGGSKREERSPLPRGLENGFSRENYRTGVSTLNLIIRVGWNAVGEPEDELFTEANPLQFATIVDWVFRRRICSEQLNSPSRDSRRMKTWTSALTSLAFLLRQGGEGVPADVLRAIQLLDRAIKEVNDVRAMCDLGDILLVGAPGVQSNTKRAVELYERAIREGNDTNCMNRFAVVLELGTGGIPVDKKRAYSLYERSIKEGSNVHAMTNLGRLLVSGTEEIPADAPRAMELYERAIREGYGPRAMIALASLLEKGANGVQADARRAVMLLEQAIREHNDTTAMIALASLLKKGAKGVQANARRAVMLLEQAIREHNDTTALNELALLLKYGAEGVPADALRAVGLCERAIQEGNDTVAMSNLGVLLESGKVPVDIPRAIALYERSIREGENVYAMTELGNLLENGAEGVSSDVRRSMRLYKRAIRKGNHAPAMVSLAGLLTKGAEGIPPDPGRAAGLYERAMQEGNDEAAANNLGVLLVNGADGVPRNAKRAVELFEGLIRETDSVGAKYNLGVVMKDGAGGVAQDPQRAVQLFEEAIHEGNHPDAMYRLGALLRDGPDGVEQDVKRAVQLFETVIERESNVSAMYDLAYILEDGAEGVARDTARAFRLYERAVEEGAHAPSMNSMGLLLQNGADGVAQDAPRAKELYERALQESNSPVAKCNLGVLLQAGAEGVAPNLVRASELYESAIREDNYVLAKLQLGMLLEDGADGVPQDVNRAVELFETVIEQESNVSAMAELASILQNGAEGVARDTARAFRLYERAVEEGAHAPSMNNMGLLLQNGAEGVAQDAPRAKELFERAIQEGNLPATKVNLGDLLQAGAEGVAPNLVGAANLYESAIREDNFAPAKTRLGMVLEDGADGVAQNKQRAVELYEEAIEQGNMGAMYTLSHFLLANWSGEVSDAHRALELVKTAMDGEIEMDAVFSITSGVIFRAPQVEMDVQSAKGLMRRAMGAGSVVRDVYSFRLVWEGFKYGRYGLGEDRELAEEIERYAAECGIGLLAQVTESGG